MEKRRPHYDLGSIKAAFTTPASLRITKTALTTAEALDLTLEDIVTIIQSIGREHFYKSMTSLVDHRVWQDVYHAQRGSLVLYVKFTTDSEGYLLISLKEK
ncbi:MAG TPA: type II toxin-antitoxin system MqsR family toxin [Polyangiaceae bacterium]